MPDLALEERPAQVANGPAPRQPRILFLDHTAALGGGELCLLDIAQHFRAWSEVLLLADGPFRQRLEAAGVHTVVLPTSRRLKNISREGSVVQDFAALGAVLETAAAVARRARGFDMIYANSQKSMIVAAVAGLIARRPVVWHLHDLLEAEHFSTLHRHAVVRLANLRIRRVIANSAATRECFLRLGGRPERVSVVHNGLDPSAFADEPTVRREALRAALGLGAGPVIGVFSRLSRWKGQHVVLEALTALPGLQCLFVGEALFAPDQRYAAELQTTAARLGLDKRVRFLGFREDVSRLLGLCDVVVHSSIAAEPFGRVIVEGMLACRPVVATAAGGAFEILEEGITGRLIPPGDAPALVAAISALLCDSSAAAAMARRGQQAAAARFALPLILERIERELAVALNKR